MKVVNTLFSDLIKEIDGYSVVLRNQDKIQT